MKKKFSNISGYFKIEKLKNDKQVVVFMVCLFIATILWFLNALSKDYSTVVSYPVRFVSPPENQFVSNELPAKLELQVEAHGFTLLRHKLSLSFSPIVLNLTNITRNQESNSGTYSILTTSLQNRISNQVSKEISISGIQPELITLVLDSLKTKMVPVLPNVDSDFKPQFNLKEPISTTPNEISITGPAILLDTIFSVYTEFKTYNKLDSDIEKMVSIIHPDNTTIKPEKVTLKIPVEKFTEKELRIPVQIKNKPDSVNIKFFPSEIKIVALVGLSEFENITPSDFKAMVDYKLIEEKVENPEVSIDKKPSFIEILRISPETVEYLIETD